MDEDIIKGERIAPPRGERIAKVIARAGLCSRREAEVLVEQGRVALDGRTVREPGTTVTPGQRVTVDGEILPALEPARLFRFHKPVGVLTTAKDPQGRETFYQGLPEGLPRLMPVGRLDINSEGLLLLTNDGGLKRHLELPRTGWLRRYRVRVYGRVEPRQLAELAEGVTVEGVRYGPIQARLDSQQASNAWLTFALQEGKNREIRQVCRHLGLQVSRLIRVAYGPFQLGSLPESALEEVPQKALKEQLGAVIAALAEPAPKGPRTTTALGPDYVAPEAPPARGTRGRAKRPFERVEKPAGGDKPARKRGPQRGGWSPQEASTAPERQKNKARSWGAADKPKALSPRAGRGLAERGREAREGESARGSAARPARPPSRAPHPDPLPARGERGDFAGGERAVRKTRDGNLDTARSPGQERRRPGAPGKPPSRGPASRGPSGARRRG
jgi:23S rRNA pseudouridine2605 synthase